MADELSPKQHKAISGLLVAPTIKEAAELAGCGERTLRGWLDEPTFQAAYQAARRQAVGQAIAQLQQMSSIAVGTLLDLMAFASPAVRLSAARTVLELAIKSVELDDIQARLAALEEAYAKKQP